MTDRRAKFGRKIEQLALALLTAKTVAEAAAAVGISESTLRRWRNTKRFQRIYDEVRRHLLTECTDRLVRLGELAIDALEKSLASENEPVWVKAAVAVIDRLHKNLDLEREYKRLRKQLETIDEHIKTGKPLDDAADSQDSEDDEA